MVNLELVRTEKNKYFSLSTPNKNNFKEGVSVYLYFKPGHRLYMSRKNL